MCFGGHKKSKNKSHITKKPKLKSDFTQTNFDRKVLTKDSKTYRFIGQATSSGVNTSFSGTPFVGKEGGKGSFISSGVLYESSISPSVGSSKLNSSAKNSNINSSFYSMSSSSLLSSTDNNSTLKPHNAAFSNKDSNDSRVSSYFSSLNSSSVNCTVSPSLTLGEIRPKVATKVVVVVPPPPLPKQFIKGRSEVTNSSYAPVKSFKKNKNLYNLIHRQN